MPLYRSDRMLPFKLMNKYSIFFDDIGSQKPIILSLIFTGRFGFLCQNKKKSSLELFISRIQIHIYPVLAKFVHLLINSSPNIISRLVKNAADSSSRNITFKSELWLTPVKKNTNIIAQSSICVSFRHR